MGTEVLFITPPLVQPNTPYPATTYLTGYFDRIGIAAEQADLSLQTLLALFSADGLTELFGEVESLDGLSDNARRIYALRHDYIATIDAAIAFLQGRTPSLAKSIADGAFLPEAARFEQEVDLDYTFGSMGLRDKAVYLATLYLEDLCDFITEAVDRRFGFSRYAERLGRYAGSFDSLEWELSMAPTFIDRLMLRRLDELIAAHEPRLVCFTVPFPGNLYSALRCGRYIKTRHTHIKVEMGGGFANTELRRLRDPRVFEYTDYITLDDGEEPLRRLVAHLRGELPVDALLRTYLLDADGSVRYVCAAGARDVPFAEIGTPTYRGLPLADYFSAITVVNPMHKLWSDGRWLKLTFAHGCYWGKCAFCDGCLDYIGRYEPASAQLIADRMEALVKETGERGFHFVDEAAPPALMRDVAIELLRRRLKVTWWTNVRFEKSFTADLCRLLRASGCIAVSGGLEVASNRLLKLINKGVTVEQVARVASHFTEAGIMVHAYLMYGFPTQTDQETVDSLEVVRQLFEAGVVESGFWHRFALTAHSPVSRKPEAYGVEPLEPEFGGFADNDRLFNDLHGGDHGAFAEGLRTSLFNYMNGVGLDFPLSDWFDRRVPHTTVAPNRIAEALKKQDSLEQMQGRRVVWIGGEPRTSLVETHRKGKVQRRLRIVVDNRSEQVELLLDEPLGTCLVALLRRVAVASPEAEPKDLASLEAAPMTLAQFEAELKPHLTVPFARFFKSEPMEDLLSTGLLFV
jgi:hypothetical protein